MSKRKFKVVKVTEVEKWGTSSHHYILYSKNRWSLLWTYERSVGEPERIPEIIGNLVMYYGCVPLQREVIYST